MTVLWPRFRNPGLQKIAAKRKSMGWAIETRGWSDQLLINLWSLALRRGLRHVQRCGNNRPSTGHQPAPTRTTDVTGESRWLHLQQKECVESSKLLSFNERKFFEGQSSSPPLSLSPKIMIYNQPLFERFVVSKAALFTLGWITCCGKGLYVLGPTRLS